MGIFSYFSVVELKIKKINILKDGRQLFFHSRFYLFFLINKIQSKFIFPNIKKNKLIDLQLNTNFCIRNKHLGDLND